MFEYKIIPVKYKSKLNKTIVIEEVENTLNEFGNNRWQLLDLQEISLSGFLYLERDSQTVKKYEYRILPMRPNALLQKPRILENENDINKLARQGFRLLNLFAHSEGQNYFMEKETSA